MSGIRLHHPSLFSCTYVVELEQEYHNRKPRFCPSCKKSHMRKSQHLRLDGNGDVMVSEDIFQKLQTVFLAGLEVSNEVGNPPTQLVGAVEMPTQQIVEHNLNTDTESSTFYLPGRNKYQSAAVMQKPFEPLLLEILERLDRIETAKKAEVSSTYILNGEGDKNG